MLLAELEVWHSRPHTPTRRVALGHLVLPADPPPGFGGILLGGVVAAHLPAVDPELMPDLHRLVNEVDRGLRVVQPRLRHRFQVDRVGLGRSRHRLVGDGEAIAFEFEDHGSPTPQILGAIYAAERLDAGGRHGVCAALHRALRWRGPIGPALISHLAGVSGARTTNLLAMADPVAWALDVLRFEPGTIKPPKKDVIARFRAEVMAAHPDHGGSEVVASKRIGDLAEARRILLS